MDTNFQTSFIPKKPLAEERVSSPHHTSIFSFVATLIFFAALASAIGMYFYKTSLVNSIGTMNTELTAASNAFEPAAIAQIQTLDRRLTDATTLLNNHIVVSPIFAALQADTLKSVQFTKFSYITPSDPTAQVTVNMSGVAKDYSSIALESDQLAMNPNIHNSIFSNLSLDETTGMVTFDLQFTVDPDLVRFTSHLDDFVSQQGTATASSGTATNGASSQASTQTSTGAAVTTSVPVSGTATVPANQ